MNPDPDSDEKPEDGVGNWPSQTDQTDRQWRTTQRQYWTDEGNDQLKSNEDQCVWRTQANESPGLPANNGPSSGRKANCEQ